MNKVDANSNERGLVRLYQAPSKEKVFIGDVIPDRVFEAVLSYLTTSEMQVAAEVDKKPGGYWQSSVTRIVEHQKSLSIKGLANFLVKNIGPEYSTLKKKISDIFPQSDISNSANLMSIRSLLLNLREQVLNELKNVSKKELCRLHVLSESHRPFLRRPEFFEKLFELAFIYQKIDYSKMSQNQEMKSLGFKRNVYDLIENGHFNKAVEIFNKISYETHKIEAHAVITRAFIKMWIKRGNIDKAIELANTISDSEVAALNKGWALLLIVRGLLQSGNIDRAIEIANTISDSEDRSKGCALLEILGALLQRGNVDKAIEVAKTISGKFYTDIAFEAISKAKESKKVSLLDFSGWFDFFKGWLDFFTK